MKKINPLLVVFLLNTFAIVAFAQSPTPTPTPDTDDIQFWNETTVEIPVSEKLSGIVIGNLRATDNISDLSDKRIGFAVKYKAAKNLTIQPSYIFRVQTRSGGSNRYEHRARLDITPKTNLGKNVVYENRSRFEHRFKTAGRDDDTFYRNRSKFKFPIKRDDKSEIATPWVSNDTYFDLQNPRVHRNDFVVGVGKKVNKILTPSVFYQYRREFQSSTKHKHIIGFNLKFVVDKWKIVK